MKKFKEYFLNESKMNPIEQEAYDAGVEAFKSGLKRIPIMDKKLNAILVKVSSGKSATSKDFDKDISIMRAWTNGWDNENLTSDWSK